MPYSREKLSASTDGRPILVAANSSPGTTVHTAVTGTDSWDEVYLWLTNTSASDVAVTVEFGGTTNPNDRAVSGMTLPANSQPVCVVPGLVLRNGLLVKVFAGTANVVTASGYVNRITP